MSTISIHPTYAVRPARAPRPRAAGQVRLTRRGRLVVFLASLAVVLGAALALSGSSTATRESGPEVATRVVHVGPGETLWQIAAQHAEDGEVREMVDELERINALDSSMLYAGQELHVPVD